MGKRFAVAIGVAAAGMMALGAGMAAGQQPSEQEIGLLFAQTASGGTMKPIEGTPRFRLTLRGVNPQVVWFSDRPARQTGHIPVRGFTRSWTGFGFVEDPPNAALTLLRADDDQDTVVVELRNPRLTKRRNRVSYSARLLDEATGNLSHLESDRDRSVKRHFRAPSLFIDDATGNVINGCLIAPYARCRGAKLPGADLSGADLSRAKLPGADLSGADLSRAKLPGADLSDADLSGAEMRGANLRGAYLFGAYLRGAFLFLAELSNADLSDADLHGANLFGANLAGANLAGANLFRTRFCKTAMPDGGTRNDDC